MSGPGGHLQGICRGWWSALRGLRDNPLPALWMRASHRRPEISVLSGCLLVLASGIAALLIWGILRLQQFIQPISAGWQSQPRVDPYADWLSGNIPLLAICTVMLGWCLRRFAASMQLALGFLHYGESSGVQGSLDDLLATARLSEYEILLGMIWQNLRMLRLPLACMSISLGLLSSRFAYGMLEHMMRRDFPGYWLLALEMMLLIYLSSCLALISLSFLAISLGLSSRAGGGQLAGASALVFMQLGLLLTGLLSIWGYEDSLYAAQTAILNDYQAALWLLGFGSSVVLLYLARRMEWLRAALQNAYPLLLCLLFLICAVPLSMAYNRYADAWTVPQLVFSGLHPLSLWGTDLQIFLMKHQNMNVLEHANDPGMQDWYRNQIRMYLDEGETEFSPLAVYRKIGGYLLWQLAYLIMFAEFARDAVRRRKWGSA